MSRGRKRKKMSKEWLSMFTANYKGETPQAKELENFLKQNYKGNDYIPWATIERLTYEQDPSAEFSEPELITKKETLRTMQFGKDLDSNLETSVDFFVHLISVSLTFLGKKVTETYPVQDKSYNAPKIIDSNMVNKAMQRAKAKVASRATGLGLKLYEGLDLQFEDDKPEPKPVKTKAVEIKPVEQLVKNTDPDLLEIADKISGREELNKGLQKINPSILKKYGFTINTTDDVDTTMEKLEKLDNPIKFLEMVEKNSEV